MTEFCGNVVSCLFVWSSDLRPSIGDIRTALLLVGPQRSVFPHIVCMYVDSSGVIIWLVHVY